MAVKHEWTEDSEAMGIAMEIISKFDEMFAGIDLGKIRFVRVLGRKNGKAFKLSPVGFPFNIDVNYLYYFQIDDEKWKQMSDEQRNLTVFSGLFEIAPGGMDAESSNYGKKRKRDVEDFEEVLAAAGGRYDWQKIGAAALPDILSDKDGDPAVTIEENIPVEQQ